MQWIAKKKKNEATILLVIAIALLAAVSASADSITIKRSVRMPSDSNTVTLGDIARLEGKDAEALSDVVVLDNTDPTTLKKLSISQIQTALEEAGVHWGKVHLSGGEVVIRPRPQSMNYLPQAMKGASVLPIRTESHREYEKSWLAADSLINEATVRGEIVSRIIRKLRRDPATIRLRFNDSDSKVLQTEINKYQVEIDPLSSYMSDRMEIAIRFWNNGKKVDSHSITIHMQIHIAAVKIARDVKRGEMIVEEMLIEESGWYAPSQMQAYANRIGAMGRIASKHLNKDDVLRNRDVEKETVISRGDKVIVRCISGGLILTLQAEARGDGKIGESVELRKVGERETFTATVAGPGEAIVNLNRK